MGIFDELRGNTIKEKKEIGKCFVCNNPIYEYEKYRTFTRNNQKYLIHISCLRKAKRKLIGYIEDGTINISELQKKK